MYTYTHTCTHVYTHARIYARTRMHTPTHLGIYHFYILFMMHYLVIIINLIISKPFHFQCKHYLWINYSVCRLVSCDVSLACDKTTFTSYFIDKLNYNMVSQLTIMLLCTVHHLGQNVKLNIISFCACTDAHIITVNSKIGDGFPGIKPLCRSHYNVDQTNYYSL